MAKMHVTLKAMLGKGTFYWVCDVDAECEEEAVVAGEHLFQAEMEKVGEWAFDDFDVETLD